MVDLAYKCCEQEGCSKRPSFNYPGQHHKGYCKEHKREGMVDVIHKRCEFPSCYNRPHYNFPGAIPPGRRFCAEHKQDGMEAVSGK
jgi:hypothetical protein